MEINPRIGLPGDARTHHIITDAVDPAALAFGLADRCQGVGMIPVDDGQALGALHAGEPLTDRLARLHAPSRYTLKRWQSARSAR